MTDTKVTGNPELQAASKEVGPQDGVPKQDGTTDQVPGDAQLKEQLEAAKVSMDVMKVAAERDISQLRSSLDKQRALDRREYDKQLQEAKSRINELATVGMDETAKAKYEAGVAKEEAVRLQQILERTQSQVEVAQSMGTYLQGFIELGVPANRLDTTSPENLMQSGWEGVATRMAELEKALGDRPADKPLPTVQEIAKDKKDAPAPKVVTTSGIGDAPAETIPQIIKKVSEQIGRPLTEEEFWRGIETGQIKSDILPGVSDQKAE